MQQRRRGRPAGEENDLFDHCVINFDDGTSAQSGDEVEFRREAPSGYRFLTDIGRLRGFNRDDQSESKFLDCRDPSPN